MSGGGEDAGAADRDATGTVLETTAARGGAGRRLRGAVRAARYGLAAVPLAWVLGRMDPAQFLQAAAAAAWWTVPFVIVGQYGGMLLQAGRWWLTQRVLAPQASLRASVSQHFVANAYAVALPGSFASDLLRSAMAARHLDPAASWAAAWMNRITGLGAWLLLALAGLALVDTGFVPPRALGVAALALAALLAVVLLSFSKRITRPLRRLVAVVLRGGALAWAERIREAVYRYRDHRRALLGLVLVAILVELLLILASAATVYGICGAWPLEALLAFIPLIEIVLVALPVMPGGVGLREALLAVLFAHLGLTEEQTGVYVALGLLSVPLRAAAGVPFLLRAGWRRRGVKPRQGAA
jgi:uncharacterized protein (TIRG00374 family)